MLRYHAKNKKIDFKRVVTTLGTENNEGRPYSLLASECSRCNARYKKQRRAVLVVLPFAGVYGSGSRCCAITLKQKKIDFKRVVTTLGTENNEGLYKKYCPLLFYGLAEVNTA